MHRKSSNFGEHQPFCHDQRAGRVALGCLKLKVQGSGGKGPHLTSPRTRLSHTPCTASNPKLLATDGGVRLELLQALPSHRAQRFNKHLEVAPVKEASSSLLAFFGVWICLERSCSIVPTHGLEPKPGHAQETAQQKKQAKQRTRLRTYTEPGTLSPQYETLNALDPKHNRKLPKPDLGNGKTADGAASHAGSSQWTVLSGSRPGFRS